MLGSSPCKLIFFSSNHGVGATVLRVEITPEFLNLVEYFNVAKLLLSACLDIYFPIPIAFSDLMTESKLEAQGEN